MSTDISMISNTKSRIFHSFFSVHHSNQWPLTLFPARMYPNCSKCMFLDFVVHQILPYQSVSVDTFNSKNDVFVAIAQPSMENCMVLEWDHIEMNFRSYDNITGIWTLRFQSLMNCWHFTRIRSVDGTRLLGFVLNLFWIWLIEVSDVWTWWLHGVMHLVNTCTFNLIVAHKPGLFCPIL